MTRRIDRFDKFLLYKDIPDTTVVLQADLYDGIFTFSRKKGKDLSNRMLGKIFAAYP